MLKLDFICISNSYDFGVDGRGVFADNHIFNFQLLPTVLSPACRRLKNLSQTPIFCLSVAYIRLYLAYEEIRTKTSVRSALAGIFVQTVGFICFA